MKKTAATAGTAVLAAFAIVALLGAASATALLAPSLLARAFATGIVAMFVAQLAASPFIPPTRCQHCKRLALKDDDDDE